jgi:plasmid stability protein
MSAAALAWLDTLTDEQRAVAVGAGPDADAERDGERRRWFYTPTDHGGLTLHAQRPAQQRLAMALLGTGTSQAGFVSAATVMGLENVLDHSENFTITFDRERGRDPGMYYLRVFGDPAGSAPWGWRFGGHHVSVSHLVVDGAVVASTPSFLGADPAVAPLLGSLLRPLAGPEDIARDLMRSLAAPLAERALLLPKAPGDIIGGNRTTLADGDRVLSLVDIMRAPFGDPVQQAALQKYSDAIDDLANLSDDEHAVLALTAAPKGLPAAELDAEQRELLRQLLSTYLDRVPDEISVMARYADSVDGNAALDAVHFAWSGSVAPGERHYYRLQGPRLLIEWDNTQRNVNHAHAAWRDPEADFGLDVLAAHTAAHHSSR